MLEEIQDLQDSDESVSATEISITVETRSEEQSEIVRKEYTFSWAKEWDKWTFIEYNELRTSADERVIERNWRQAQHIMWTEPTDTATIDVPPEVAEELARATGADSVTIQSP